MTVNTVFAASAIALSLVGLKLAGIAINLPPNAVRADLAAQARALALNLPDYSRAQRIVADNNAVEVLPAPLLATQLRVSAR